MKMVKGKQEEFIVNNKHILLSFVVIFILGLVVYFNSLRGEFIWDDYGLVVNNTYIRSWSNIKGLFFRDITGGFGRSSSFYRPLQSLSYMFDYSLYGLNPGGYHFTNILLHISVAIALFWFIKFLYYDFWLSFVVAVLFLVHPIHTEAVSYISGRADILSALFLLCAFISYIKHLLSGKKAFYIIMIISYVLALFSREGSLIFPILIGLYHYSFKKKIKFINFFNILAVTFLYLIIRINFAETFSSLPLNIYPIWPRMPGAFVALTNYLRLLFFPFNLHMEYGQELFSFLHYKSIIGIILFFSLLFIIFNQKKTRGVVFFSLVWFLLSFLMISNIYPLNAYMAEHWLYFPSIGIFLIFAKALLILSENRKKKIIFTTSFLVVVIFYSYLTIRHNSYWANQIFFCKRTLQYSPENSSLYNNLGLAYYDADDFPEAIKAYKKALSIEPDFAQVYHNLALAYYAAGKVEKAINFFNRAISIDPELVEAYNNLGIVYRDLDKGSKAISLWLKAIRIDPGFALVYCNIGIYYKSLGEDIKAMDYLRKAISFDPGLNRAKRDLIDILEKNRDTAQ